MCREGKADMALDLFMNARAEGIKPNVTICDSITGTCHQLHCLEVYLNQWLDCSGINSRRKSLLGISLEVLVFSILK